MRGHDTEKRTRRIENLQEATGEGGLEEGAFDKDAIAETICDRIASEQYGEVKLGEKTVDAFESLVEVMNGVLKRTE